jgi:hypothetical protein
MHRLQYPCTCRTFGISADMHKLPRGNACGRIWLPHRAHRQVSQAAAIRLSAEAVFDTVFFDQK